MPLSFQRLLTFLRSILHAIPPAPSAPTSSSPEASDSGARESRSAAARCGDAGVLGRARVEGWMCGWGGRTPMGCGLRRRRRRRRAREERGWRRFLAGAPRLGESGVLSLAHSGYIKLKKKYWSTVRIFCDCGFTYRWSRPTRSDLFPFYKRVR